MARAMGTDDALKGYEREIARLEKKIAEARMAPRVCTYDLRSRDRLGKGAGDSMGVNLMPRGPVMPVNSQLRSRLARRSADHEEEEDAQELLANKSDRRECSPELFASPAEVQWTPNVSFGVNRSAQAVAPREIYVSDDEAPRAAAATRANSRPEGEVVQLPRGYREMERTRNGKKDSQEPWRSEPEDFRRHSFVKPPKFDGKGCVESHLLQFKIAASRNQWTSSEKADFLKISLTGEASAVLKDMEEDITFEELSDKLKQCFGTLEQQEVFKIQLKARRRRKGESLSELMKDVRRLFLQAYPGQMNVLSLAIAKDAFIDALEDKELMIRVMEREPKSLEEAFKIAERMELYSRKVNAENGAESEGKMRNTSHKVRSTSSTDEDTIKTLLENQKTIQRQMSELMHQMQVSNSSANKERKVEESGGRDKGDEDRQML